ncbi:putative aspartyl protease [Parabacteroides sp. PF5-5]|uniref:retropepsin-like aspartic protease n=1 Tax=unclassified Parabacteroides TaxID=2649774 RepID=UPI002474CEB0|nr:MULTISPECIES: retropepsin-like aspartic protease [unclassified Parabacteroides]MDH6305382.1 putative aspartyl protease [Parabacteroides sp. PH5-39]MDH6316092.1 putative aspartyl protease [Parabacteroides sp. PF5-13]MDH6320242.1 putative aspartyl protease [Parabacteroides sp. PH5-13]MDH6323972.1 putative aspartyl protease [Parabacteroides sp. PH5-8]MDH6327283.1 putative aspartyl protease [Parabacteroides sp. PH5-41]
MQRLLVCILWVLTLPVMLHAQDAEQRMDDLMNQHKWFELKKEFPLLKDKIQKPMLRLMPEALMNTFFNKPLAANTAIGELIGNYQQEMGAGNTFSMVFFMMLNDFRQGNYQSTNGLISSFIEQASSSVPPESLDIFEYYYLISYALLDYPAPKMVHAKRDVTIPIEMKEAKKGHNLLAPVRINKKEYSFIFDTSASNAMISEQLALEMGVRSIADSIPVMGVAGGYAKLGVIDSLAVGDLMYYNMPCLIATLSPEAASVYQTGALLGTDFINALGEIQIYPKEGKLLVPATKTPLPASGSNIRFEGSMLLLNMNQQENGLTEEQTQHMGAEDSSLGLDFAGSYSKVLLNLEDMFIKVEP